MPKLYIIIIIKTGKALWMTLQHTRREGKQEGNHTLVFRGTYIFHWLCFISIAWVFWFSFFLVWIIALLLVLWHQVAVLSCGWQPNLLADDSPRAQRDASLCLVTVRASELTEKVSFLSEKRQKQKWGWDFCQNKNIYLILL